MGHLNNLQLFCVFALPVLFAITLHECAHGWVANKCGDPTALLQGRLSINPLHHIDLLGTILMPLLAIIYGGFIFGWAKPVPVNWNKLRNPRRDTALVAAAGPIANLLMAVAWAIFGNIGILAVNYLHEGAIAIVYMGLAGITVNVCLMVLNLVPIPPLDGSRIVASFLSPNALRRYYALQPLGLPILLILLMSGLLFKVIGPLYIGLESLIITVFLPLPMS